MSDQQESNKPPEIHYEGGVPILDIRRLSEVERKQAEAERRDERYKNDQITLTRRLVYATVALVIATIVMGVVGGIQLWYIHRQWKLTSAGLSKMGDQIWAAKDTAYASKGASETATQALKDSESSFKQTLAQMKIQTAAQERAAKAARDASDIARRQVETSLRPWMSVVSSSVEYFSFVPSSSPVWPWGLNIQPKLIIKNVGNLPAVNVRLIGDIFLANWSKHAPAAEARERQEKLCSEGGSGVVAIGEPATIVPGGAKEYNFAMRRDVDDAGEIFKGMVTPILVGCIAYEYSTSLTIHQSGFLFYVYGRYNGQGSNLFYGKSISAADMYLADAGEGVSLIVGGERRLNSFYATCFFNVGFSSKAAFSIQRSR